jgi:hypothetical protein
VTVAYHFLYFYTPCLTLRDVRIALQFVAQYGGREGFFVILKTHRRTFDDYIAVERALRDYYGVQKDDKKATEENSPQAQVKKALFRESALKGLDFEERKKVIKIEKLFKGRWITPR